MWTDITGILPDGEKIIVFGDITIDTADGRILNQGEEVSLGPRPSAVLLYLIVHRQRVVTKQELFKEIWGTDFVTDAALTQAVKEIRLALGDNARSPRYIRTVFRKGYKFIARVEQGDQVTKRSWHAPGIALALTVATALILAVLTWNEPAEPLHSTNSIAVLPFDNRSSNPDDVHFADGIHDDLIAYLAKIGSIKTISRVSVMQYRDTHKPTTEIAAELGAAHILEGGVQRVGDHVRLNVQLIDGRTDEHLWSEIYDRQLSASNLFAIQSEITRTIANELQATLSPSDERRLYVQPTESLAALEAYMVGKNHLNRRGKENLAEAEDQFRQAVELDPGYALAWASLGATYLVQRQDASVSDRGLLDKALAAVEMALSIDPGLGEADATLGMLNWTQGDSEEAEKHYLAAIEKSPNYATSYYWYSQLLRAQGRTHEALKMALLATQLDPRSPVIRQNLAIAYRTEGRYQEALAELEKALAIDAGFANAYDAIATIEYQVFNRFPESVRNFVKVLELDSESAFGHAFMGQVYLNLGEPGRAGILFDRARELVPDSFGEHWGSLLLRVHRGDIESITHDAEAVLKDVKPGYWIAQFTTAQQRNRALASGWNDEAIALYAERYPELLDDPEVVIGLQNYRAAIDLSLVLQRTGQAAQADQLLSKCQAFIQERPRLGWHGGYWVSDVQILALQGRKEEALAALRRAADEGWRALWWYYLEHDPNLAPIRAEPAFQAIVSEIEADMSAQMQQVREMEQSGEIGAVPGVSFGSL